MGTAPAAPVPAELRRSTPGRSPAPPSGTLLTADREEEPTCTTSTASPLRYTPHDLRRIFATETVNGGLPLHIAQTLLGHLDLNTTQGYVAVYPEQVIQRYRDFVDRRRETRSGEEYRDPTRRGMGRLPRYFSLRKVALGTCHRPYGTPCVHEHACVRCPMLQIDPAQKPRLLEPSKPHPRAP